MTEEFNELRDAVRQVVAGLGTWGGEDVYWQQCVELGWLMVSVPESLGGLEMGTDAAVAVQLELGSGLCGAPCLSSQLAVEAIVRSSLGDKATRLEQIFSGAQIAFPLQGCELSQDAGLLSGRVTALPSAESAQQAVIWTSDRQLVALVPVEHAAAMLQVRETWDTTRRLFELTLSSLPLTDTTVLAEGNAAEALIDELLRQRDLGLAADAIGAANSLLSMTVDHLNTRVQFRRPLAMFQALKHRCADMKTLIVASEALLMQALAQSSSEAAMSAKQLATDSFAAVAEEALQLHGGIGMAVEHPCHLFLKRALLNRQLGRGLYVYPEAAVAALGHSGAA